MIDTDSIAPCSIHFPKISDWEMVFLERYIISLSVGNVPCWFHRKMQELCFGVKWRKKCSSPQK